jgi:hypothetical protein
VIDPQPPPADLPAPSTDLAAPAEPAAHDPEPRLLVLLDADDALTCTDELCLPSDSAR